MPALTLPIHPPELLALDAPGTVPDGFTVVTALLESGIPATIKLDAEFSAWVLAPTGDAQLWRDAADEAVASASDEQGAALAPDTDAAQASSVRPRFALRRGTTALGQAPLTLNSIASLPDDGDDRNDVVVEIVALDWEVRAATMCEPGQFGSSITLAWRRVGEAAAAFSAPPASPVLVRRMPPELKSESELGMTVVKKVVTIPSRVIQAGGMRQ
jgi:hypothetical protein